MPPVRLAVTLEADVRPVCLVNPIDAVSKIRLLNNGGGNPRFGLLFWKNWLFILGGKPLRRSFIHKEKNVEKILKTLAYFFLYVIIVVTQ